MTKKILSALLVLCLLLSLAVCAQAADKPLAPCKTEGHYRGDGLNHDRPSSCWTTGHRNCDDMDHSKAACNIFRHVNCDGKDHTPAVCGVEGHYNCDYKDHAVAECGIAGHCGGDGKNHGPAKCGVEGHYACDGYHTSEVISKYCDAEPQHKKCEGDVTHYCDPENGGCGETYLCKNSNAHTTCSMCGLLWCDDSLGGHETPCGIPSHRPCVYAMEGRTWSASAHPICPYCGGGKCYGKHGNGVCVETCNQCGGPLVGVSSHKAPCGVHYTCISGSRNHSWCSECGQLKCLGDGKHVCP